MRKECKIPKSELEALLSVGLSYAEIASEDGCNAHQVKYRARSFGLRSFCAGHKAACSEAEFRALIADSSLNIAQIAEVLGLSAQAVRQRALRLRLPTGLRKRGARYHPRKLSLDDLSAALDAGMKTGQIARAFGMTRQAVQARRKSLEASNA